MERKKEMRRLVKLEIVTKGSIANSSIKCFFHFSPNLQHVKLQTKDLTDEYFITIDRCQRLKYIDISFDVLPTDLSVKYIADGCAELQFVDVSYWYWMIENILNILSSLKQIRELRIDCYNFISIQFQHCFRVYLHSSVK
jgi:hypothetical protein